MPNKQHKWLRQHFQTQTNDLLFISDLSLCFRKEFSTPLGWYWAAICWTHSWHGALTTLGKESIPD
jgi:hypothetical protein